MHKIKKSFASQAMKNFMKILIDSKEICILQRGKNLVIGWISNIIVIPNVFRCLKSDTKDKMLKMKNKELDFFCTVKYLK